MLPQLHDRAQILFSCLADRRLSAELLPAALVGDDVPVARQHVHDGANRLAVMSEAGAEVHGDRGARPELEAVGFLGRRHPDVDFVQGPDLLVSEFCHHHVCASGDVVRIHDLAALDQREGEVRVIRVVRDIVDEPDAASHDDEFTLLQLEALADLAAWRFDLDLDVLAGLAAFLGHLREELVHLRRQGTLPELALGPVDHGAPTAHEVSARAITDNQALVDQHFQTLDSGRTSRVPLGGDLRLRRQSVTRAQGPIGDLSTEFVRDALVEGPCPAADCHGRCLQGEK